MTGCCIEYSANDAAVIVVSKDVFHAIPNHIDTFHFAEYLQSNLALDMKAKLEFPDISTIVQRELVAEFHQGLLNLSSTAGKIVLQNSEDYIRILNDYLTSSTIAIHWWQKSWISNST